MPERCFTPSPRPYSSELRRIRREVLLDHQCDLEDNGMVEFPQVQTSQLLDLFQTVHQCVPVYKQLSGSFRNIQVVLEELLNGKQRFMIQRFNAAPLEYLVKKCFTQRGRQVIDQAGNAQILIVLSMICSSTSAETKRPI